MGIEQEINNTKIEILDNIVSRNEPQYTFFHDLATNIVYTQDKLVPLFKGLDDVIGSYKITSGYLTIEEAEQHMRLQK